MEKKRKSKDENESNSNQNEIKTKKIKKKQKNKTDNEEKIIPSGQPILDEHTENNSIEFNEKRDKKKNKKNHNGNDNIQNKSNGIDETNNEINNQIGDISNNNDNTSIETESNQPTTKKPSRNQGETKKQYKRRIKLLRESGLLIDPVIEEGIKKDKKNRKTRKEKRQAKEKKVDDLDKYRCIIQMNYLKTWKNNKNKWKFNKNVQGKLIKNMFNVEKIPADIFDILVEYISESNSKKLNDDMNKKCSTIIEQMEIWTSANEEEKKTLTEPNSITYARARQILQSLT